VGTKGKCSNLIVFARHYLEVHLHDESRMHSALNLALNTGRAQRLAGALVLLVFAFALQPCAAMAVPIKSHPCCPMEAPKCHAASELAACAMSSTGFAMPEDSATSNEVDARLVQPIVSSVVPAAVQAEDGTFAVAPMQGPVFLLISVLLI